MDKIYLDNAATTIINPSVIEVMHEVMQRDFGNPSSIHSYGRSARTIVEKSRKTVADILNASTGEIFFTSSATESNNMAIYRSVVDLGVKRIISSPTEHPCVLNSIKSIQQLHPEVDIFFLSPDHLGRLDPAELDSVLSSKKTKTLVSLMHGNNEIGTMLDLEKISQVCDSHDALFHCDTVQTIGKFQLDLQQIKISFLSGSGHKIYGPKGVGIIYINQDNMIKAMIHGGGQERQLRSGTENIYGIAGFAKALELLESNRASHHDHLIDMRNYFKTQLTEQISGIGFNGVQENEFLPHILNVSIPKTDKTDLIMFNLDIHGICASAGSACSSGSERGSHVLEAIKSSSDRKSIRFSLGPHNTKAELDTVTEKLAQII